MDFGLSRMKLPREPEKPKVDRREVAAIRRKRASIAAKMTKLHQERADLERRCKHPNASKKHCGDTGNWCRGDDSYWTEFTCPDCGKFWQVDGSV